MDTSYHYQGKGLFQQGQEVDTGGCDVENNIAVAQLPDDPQVLKDIIEKLGNEIDGLRDRTNTAVNTLLNEPTEICDGEDNDFDGTSYGFMLKDPNATMRSTMPSGKDDQSSKEVCCDGLDEDCDGDGIPDACDNCRFDDREKKQ